MLDTPTAAWRRDPADEPRMAHEPAIHRDQPFKACHHRHCRPRIVVIPRAAHGRLRAIASSIIRRVAGSSALIAIEVTPAAATRGVVGCRTSGRASAAWRRALAILVFWVALMSRGIELLRFVSAHGPVFALRSAKQLEVGTLAISLYSLAGFVWLAAVLAARRDDQFADVFRLPTRIADTAEQTKLGILAGREAQADMKITIGARQDPELICVVRLLQFHPGKGDAAISETPGRHCFERLGKHRAGRPEEQVATGGGRVFTNRERLDLVSGHRPVVALDVAIGLGILRLGVRFERPRRVGQDGAEISVTKVADKRRYSGRVHAVLSPTRPLYRVGPAVHEFGADRWELWGLREVLVGDVTLYNPIG